MTKQDSSVAATPFGLRPSTQEHMGGSASGWRHIAAGLVLAIATVPAPAATSNTARTDDSHRSGSNVLPPDARPSGYSLHDLAAATAQYNEVTDANGNHLGPAPVPARFQMLATTETNKFVVAAGTVLYVPVVFNDNGPPVIGDFPTNAENHRKLMNYWYSQRQFGVVASEITVDGKVKSLGGEYVVGVSLASPLLDGATQYATTAAFIAGLPVGVHTVQLHFKATGDALRVPPFDGFFPAGIFESTLTYTVTVQ